MTQITSGIGLVSGINYGTLIDNLINADSAVSNALNADNTTLKSEQTAITALMANLTAIKGATDALGQTSLFDTTTATSSNTNVLSVATTGIPAAGTYQYTALSKAQAQQVISSGYESNTAAIGSGTLTLRFGNSVDTGMSLDNVNGGAGFTPGSIKITDRSGTSAVIDLSGAKTIDDVLSAINDNGTADVTASVAGDKIVLTDNSGETTANLKVQEVNSGKTAASLGLSGVNVASGSATGADIVYLSNNLNLSALNDGIGVEMNNSAPDMKYTLSNGDTGEIALSGAKTLGDVVNKINASSQYLKASISSDGSRLMLTDSSAGTAAAFSVSAENGSQALADLGLTGTAANGVITGSRIISWAKTVLLSDLNGGKGLGTLGKITLTDRADNSADVDLSGAQTLEDVIDAVNNASGVQITAQVNQAGNGIELVDTSGQTTSNLKVDDFADGTTTATKLFGSAVNVAADSADSGDMHLKIIGLNTQLAGLNGGAGVAQGKFTITNSKGNTGTVNITSSVKTIGDVVQAINLSGTNVLAEINDTGDGIVISDANGGSGALTVSENGSTTAADLNLLGTAVTANSTQSIDGSMTRTVNISNTDTLATVANTINALGAGVTASVVSDGSDMPYHLSIVSNQTGKQGAFVLDTSKADLSFGQISEARDALLAVGYNGSSTKAMLVTSSTNDFTNVLNGATLTIQNVSDTPVTVSVGSDTTNLASQIESFVNSYNTFRQTLATDTAYDTTTNTPAVLTGDYQTMRADAELSQLVSNYYPSGNSIASMAQLGITVNNDGSLSLDQSTLNSVLSTNLADVKSLFTTADTGVSAQFSKILTNLAVDTDTSNPTSLMGLHNQTLGTEIDNNQTKIDQETTRLANERTQLTNQFANLEVTLAQLQSNYSALSSIDWMLDNGSSSSSSNSLFGNTSSNSNSLFGSSSSS